MIEVQELHCHNCDRYVRFNLDLSLDGNYRLNCPNCGHDHYRIVKKGKIMDGRWGQSSTQWQQISSTGYFIASFSNSSTSSSHFLTNSWVNTTAA